MSRRQPTRRYPRVARVNEVVREVLAEELKRLSDPRLAMVTITGVDVKSDLRTATIYYSSLARTDEEKADVAKALGRASTHFRQVLGRQVRLKNTPALAFVVDPAIEAGERIDAVLRDLERNPTETIEPPPGQ